MKLGKKNRDDVTLEAQDDLWLQLTTKTWANARHPAYVLNTRLQRLIVIRI